MLNACAVKSVFTCFSIIFSQLVRRASCCSVDVFYTAIDCDVSDLFTGACVQSKAFRKFVCILFWRNKFNVVYVSNPWIWTENMYLSTPPASVFNSIQPWRHKFHGKSARCWKISALLIFQRLADFPALFQHFSSSSLDGWMLEYISSPSASTRSFSSDRYWSRSAACWRVFVRLSE